MAHVHGFVIFPSILILQRGEDFVTHQQHIHRLIDAIREAIIWHEGQIRITPKGPHGATERRQGHVEQVAALVSALAEAGDDRHD